MQESEKKSLIEFPCRFPIKVMGANVDTFAQTIATLVTKLDPSFDPASMKMRPSRSGNYLGLTCEVHVTSQDELDEVYRTLSTHPMVSMVV